MITLSRSIRLAGAAAVLGLSATTVLAEAEGALDAAPLPGVERSSPLADSIRTTVEGRYGAGSPVAEVYAVRADRPLWLDGDGSPNAAAGALLDALAAAPGHALPAERYRADELALQAMALSEGAGPAERAGFEMAMTRALIAYATDVTSGAVTPREIDSEIKVNPPRPDAAVLLQELADAPDPAAWLAALPPASADYARLRQHYAEMQQVVASGGWGEPVPEGRTLRAGDSGKRVEALRARLIAMGDLSAGASRGEGAVIAENTVASDAGTRVALTDPWVYDEGLVAAVKRFQARHGLNTDGVVGPATLAALNTPAKERLGQIAVNMERLRWLNRDLGDRHIMVNIAGYTMALVENGRETFTSRVVVGQSKHPTPEFSDEMEHLVVNPSWNVPWSIATKEILPKLRQDPTYLDRNNMQLVGGPDPWFIDWWSVTPSTFPGRVKQNPGPGNALGRVKFMFPNNNAVYLHDTPAKSLFAKDMRAHSHGCVRVEKPFEFARILLAAQESDPAVAFERMLDRGREQWVNLEEHIPVHIGYRTAWIDEEGTEQYRADVYGRDERVLRALNEAGLTLAAN